MLIYRLALYTTLVVIVFLSVIHIGSKMPYYLNKVYQKEPNGMRLFNRFYLTYLLPWMFVPLISSVYFRTYFVIYLLMFTLAMEDGLYVHGLYTQKNKEKFIIMLLFNLLVIALIYILAITYLEGFPLFNLV
ncbi:MAG: hypothetical protein WBI17_03345 [Clostridiaceae bacterium]